MNDSQQQTAALRQFLAGILGESPFGIVTISPKLEITAVNEKAITYIEGSSEPKQFIDKPYTTLFNSCQPIVKAVKRLQKQNKHLDFDLERVEHKSFILNVKSRHMLLGTLIIIEDFTLQHQLESKLFHQATYDHLTQLVNRKEFEVRLERFLDRHQASGTPGVVAFIDLDRFKPINDEAGHKAGDQLLQEVAIILTDATRSRDTVSRIGGDEFALLLESCSLQSAIKLLENVLKIVRAYKLRYEEKIYNVGLSAGVCAVSKLYTNASAILNAADNACQLAKSNGRNRIHVVKERLGEYEEHHKEIQWISTIERALEHNDFELYVQKIQSLKNEDRDFYEVLIRLNLEGKTVSPALFIPIAERFDLITEIDYWVIETTFKMITSNVVFSINVSGKTISEFNFVSIIDRLASKYEVTPAQIIFELTETAAMSNPKSVIETIKALRTKGFQFALDDFGSGLSSLIYLKNIPINYIKVDGEIVKDIDKDQITYTMLEAINNIASAMDIKTIAEHVETDGIYKKLVEADFDLAQGFYIESPFPLKKLLGKHSKQV